MTELHVTIETEESLFPGVKAALAAGVPSNINALLVGREDFDYAGHPSGNLLDEFEELGINPNYGSGGQILDIYATRAGSTGSSVSGLKRENLDVRDALNEGASYMDQWPEESCVLTVPMENTFFGSIHLKTDILAAIITRMEGTDIVEGLPGSPEEIQLLIGLHELDHCENTNSRFHEYESDAHANSEFAKQLGGDVAKDPEVPYFFRSQRAAAAVMGVEGDEYTTNGLSPLAGEKKLSNFQLARAESEIRDARDIMFDRIEEDTSWSKEELQTSDGSVFLGPLAYIEMKKMISDGTLDDKPYAKLNAERFIDGAERYDSDVYMTDDVITKPPIMPAAAYGPPQPTLAPQEPQPAGFQPPAPAPSMGPG